MVAAEPPVRQLKIPGDVRVDKSVLFSSFLEIKDENDISPRAYFYPWNSQGSGVSGGPGISAKSTNTAGFLLMGNINGELYFGVAQNESGYKWFKLTGATAL